jgi:hypothetical protein
MGGHVHKSAREEDCSTMVVQAEWGHILLVCLEFTLNHASPQYVVWVDGCSSFRMSPVEFMIYPVRSVLRIPCLPRGR